MALRLLLWALFVGTLVMGYFGLQSGTASTTLLGALIIAAIVFILYFLVKNLIGFGATILKWLIIMTIIFFTGVALMNACNIVVGKTKEVSKSVSNSVTQKMTGVTGRAKNMWYDNGEVSGSKESMMDKIKNFVLNRNSKAVIPPTQNMPVMPGDQTIGPGGARAIGGTVTSVESGYLFKIGSTFVKLFGIDAPDPGQNCVNRQGDIYPCGHLSKNKLKMLVLDQSLTCSLVATDGMGNYVAACKMGIYDVGAVMVASGWAVADRNSTNVYVPYEIEAQEGMKGLWEGKFMAPWTYRRLNAAPTLLKKIKKIRGAL